MFDLDMTLTLNWAWFNSSLACFVPYEWIAPWAFFTRNVFNPFLSTAPLIFFTFCNVMCEHYQRNSSNPFWNGAKNVTCKPGFTWCNFCFEPIYTTCFRSWKLQCVPLTTNNLIHINLFVVIGTHHHNRKFLASMSFRSVLFLRKIIAGCSRVLAVTELVVSGNQCM